MLKWKLKNPETEFNGEHVEKFLGKNGKEYRIHPIEFAFKCKITPSYVYEIIGTKRTLRKNLFDKIKEAYPDFGQ